MYSGFNLKIKLEDFILEILVLCQDLVQNKMRGSAS